MQNFPGGKEHGHNCGSFPFFQHIQEALLYWKISTCSSQAKNGNFVHAESVLCLGQDCWGKFHGDSKFWGTH